MYRLHSHTEKKTTKIFIYYIHYLSYSNTFIVKAV